MQAAAKPKQTKAPRSTGTKSKGDRSGQDMKNKGAPGSIPFDDTSQFQKLERAFGDGTTAHNDSSQTDYNCGVEHGSTVGTSPSVDHVHNCNRSAAVSDEGDSLDRQVSDMRKILQGKDAQIAGMQQVGNQCNSICAQLHGVTVAGCGPIRK